MSESTLYTILAILLLLLIPLLLSYKFYPVEKLEQEAVIKKKKTQQREIDKTQPLSFEDITHIFGSSSSSKEDFIEAIEQLIRHHGKIQAKLGDLAHPDFKRYQKAIITLCKNRKSDKDVIVALNQKLRALNTKYGYEIDEAVSKGIEGRGF
jgi:hypothetical protein